jgi:hypothetical protein
VKAMNSAIVDKRLMRSPSLLGVLRVSAKLLLVDVEILRRNRENGSRRVHDALATRGSGRHVELHVIDEEPMRRLVASVAVRIGACVASMKNWKPPHTSQVAQHRDRERDAQYREPGPDRA